MSEIKLKPCPFCGGEAVIRESGCGHDVIEAYVLCGDCGASSMKFAYGYMSGRHQEAYDQAAAAWNTRKPVDAVLDRLEESKDFYATRYAKNLDPYDQGSYEAYEDTIEIIKEGLT